MESVWKSYLRWRHSRGYGVHSPFAYSFVKDVLRSGRYGYYAIDELNRLLNIHRIKGREIWTLLSFLIRVCRFLKIRRIVINQEWSEAGIVLSKAMQIGLFVIKEGRYLPLKEEDMMIIKGPASIPLSIINNALSAGIPVMMLNPDKQLREFMKKPMPDGVKFEWRDKILAIPRKEMRHVSYIV